MGCVYILLDVKLNMQCYSVTNTLRK